MDGGKKKAGSTKTACQGKDRGRLGVGLGLAEPGDTVARLPLTALLQEVHTLEALEDVAFNDEAGLALETFVL
jgi:hypothetical protein